MSRLYALRTSDGGEWIAAWSADDAAVEVTLPRPALAGLSIDGQELTVSGDRVAVDGAPRYFQLEPE